MDDTLHVELVMPFVWNSAFEVLKEQCSADLLRITGAKRSTGNCRTTLRR
ncbi:antiporter inner membrane protein [Salmonella enterica subsp. enterica serovar Heidelberg str. 76-0300]|nr:antiporter inner membrane protein [Salmonella enterica subsp. enterica serovar Heidelberg str. 76-0300]